MTRSARMRWCVLMVTIFLFLPALSHAQELAGLVGTVTDESGGAINKATVTLVNTRTGFTTQSQTGDTGLYRFVQLAPGPGYELKVSKDGFRSTTISNLYLAVATTRTQDIQLSIGTVSQTVEVKSEGSVSLDTTDSTIGNNFDLRAVSSLPNEFRGDVANLLRLQPAVVSADQHNNLDDQGGSRNGAVAGGRADQDNITVDGIDASDFGVGRAFHSVAPIPVDAIQEFRTEVANPLAQEGRGSGAQTIITTKSGTNEWHGNAREYHRNTITEANDFFNNKNGVPRPALIRNQFGGNVGGPIKKDKLFFFFDYDGRRDASQTPVNATVPLDNVRQGKIGYINNGTNPANGQPCDFRSTQTSTPGCISFADTMALAKLDPCSSPATAQGPCTVTGNAGDTAVTPGFNPGLLALFNSRYPHSNNLAAGDGINTGGFIFNAPNPVIVNTYTTRVDYEINSKQKLYTRFNFFNSHAIANGLPSIQFPGDPITNPAIGQDRSWVIGHNWVISPTLVNTFVYGESRAELDALATLTGTAAPGPNLGVYAGLNWLFPTGITAPFARPGGSTSLNPVPTFRDDVSWQKGKHSFQFGGVFRPIRTRSLLVNNIIFTNQGLVTNLGALDGNLRPNNILSDPALDPNAVAATNWDASFASFAGLDGLQFSVFNYAKNGNVIPPVQGARRDYRYYESEAYAQDTWKVRRDLTVTLGLRYGYDSVPYESNGYESTTNVQLSNLLTTRGQNALNGVATFDSTPLLTYNLAGKGNNAGSSLYQSSPLNFSPRLGVAWNPGFSDGVLGSILGNHKTVVRASAALIYDHAALSAVNFIQDQSNFLFSGSNSFSANANTPEQLFAISPRFTSVDSAAVNIPIPPFQKTDTPFTGNQCPPGIPVCGTVFNQFGNYVIDPHYKTPYSLAYSVGIQRELPSGFQLETDYVLRLGRRLGALADAGQIFNFVDPASKQSLAAAVSALEIDARNNVPVGNVQIQPFFENQLAAAGANCAPFANCTQFVYRGSGNFTSLQQGNLNGVIRSLAQSLNLGPNVGFAPQFVSNYYPSNKAYSAYNGLIVILRKRLSQGVQMDFNYTFSHSVDNFSAISNNNGNPFNNAQSVACDAINLGTCKGNSEFDVTHQISGDAIYDLPFGRGKAFGRNSSRWLDEIIGGWQASGVYTWRTGFAFPVLSNASTTTFGNSAYAIFNGNNSALQVDPHTDPNLSNSGIQLFKNPAAALAAFSAPTGLQTGSRDELRGPHFSNVDLALVKNFPIFREKYKLQFRAEAYNAFNHPNFALPVNINIDQPNFGLINSTSSTSGDQSARVLQFGLRLDF
jgi:hypothetical protein